MNNSKSIFRKDIVFISLISLLVLIAAYIGAIYSYRSIHEDQLTSLASRAKTISMLINPDSIKGLDADISDLEKPAYQALKENLTKMRELYPDTRFIYIVKKNVNDPSIYFIADSEHPSSKDYSPPGQKYSEAPRALLQAFDTKGDFIEEYTDRWGNWISAFAPIINRDGTIVGVVGIDIDAKQHQKTIYVRIGSIILGAFILLIALIIFYLFRKKEESVIMLKSEFIALASHELRSPLTVMRWQLSIILKDKKIPAKIKKQLDEVNRAIVRLVSMTGSILETTAAEHQLEKKQITARANLATVIHASLDDAVDIADHKRITFRLGENCRKTILVKGEEEKLELVIINILNNAIKYSPDDSFIDIDIALGKKSARITVRDYGIGIPHNEVEHIFDGFYRAKNALSSGVRGSGFGLYMTKKIVEFYNGKIKCDSEPGQGTVFTIILPM